MPVSDEKLMPTLNSLRDDTTKQALEQRYAPVLVLLYRQQKIVTSFQR